MSSQGEKWFVMYEKDADKAIADYLAFEEENAKKNPREQEKAFVVYSKNSPPDGGKARGERVHVLSTCERELWAIPSYIFNDNKNPLRVIGIVGGMGPLAGAELFKKVVNAVKGDDNIGVVLMSDPACEIFSDGASLENLDNAPIDDIWHFLYDFPDFAVTMVCSNNFHILMHSGDDQIVTQDEKAGLGKIVERLDSPHSNFMSMFQASEQYCSEMFAGKTVGLIANSNMVKYGTFNNLMSAQPILYLEQCQDDVQNGIGMIESDAQKAKEEFLKVIQEYSNGGAEVLLIGDTEIPKVVTQTLVDGHLGDGNVPVVSSTDCLIAKVVESIMPEEEHE